ncbi:MAG: hypothetical protein KAS12_01420 [Candidatus Aenigmarchaeota archaeon]|nr:hypothetical protein [Candidatus Aenigmarchaeota archaeon]
MDTLRSISKYIDSAQSKAKFKIIHGIAEDINKLGIKGIDLNETDTVKLAENIVKVIPNPRKRTSFQGADIEQQKRHCKEIGAVLNSRYGNNVIDINAPAERICNNVYEFMSSLATGMHTEFLAVITDIKKIIRSLAVLQKLYKDVQDKLSKTRNSTCEKAKNEADDLAIALEKINIELNRQLELLNGVLGGDLTPENDFLIDLFEKDKNGIGKIREIKVGPGTRGFADELAILLTNVGNVAVLASRVDKALKKVGITIQKYMDSESLGNFKKEIEKIKQEKLDKMDIDEVQEFLASADILRKNFATRDDFKEELERRGGDDENATTSRSARRKNIDNRLKLEIKKRELLFKGLNEEIGRHLNKIIFYLNTIADKVGGEIPLSTTLMNFTTLIDEFKQFRKKNYFYVLSGYYNDINSRQKREEFTRNLRLMTEYINDMLAMDLYSGKAGKYFSELKTEIQALTLISDKVADKFAEKYGRGENDENNKNDQLTHDDNLADDDEFTYGGDDDLNKPIDLPPISTNMVNFGDIMNKFKYKFRIAKVKENMKHTAEELKHYSENYESLLGEAIGLSIDKLAGKKETLTKQISDDKEKLEYFKIDDKDTLKKKEKEELTKFINEQFLARQKFFETLEVIDTYMAIFTDAIITNPDDVNDIKAMLNDADTIFEWFNEKSGENIIEAFDQFPFSVGAEGAKISRNKDHYYDDIKVGLLTEVMPGNPFVCIDVEHAVKSKEAIKKTFDTMAVLKNFISLFVNIGKKFGGKVIQSNQKMFMTPAQIHRNLVNYLINASFNIGITGDKYGKNWKMVDLKEIPVCKIASEDCINVGAFGVFTIEELKTLAEFFGNTTSEVKFKQVWLSAKYDITKDPNIGSAEFTNVGIISILKKLEDMLGANVVKNEEFIKKLDKNFFLNIIKKKNLGITMTHCHDKIFNNYEDECALFAHAIKAMAAKIFTVMDMYDMLERPGQYTFTSPLRMIVGGYVAKIPEIKKECVELFIRIPLLAEFYRDLFAFSDNTAEQFSMMPELGTPFSGIIKQIFIKASGRDTGNYTDDEWKILIEDINGVYDFYKKTNKEKPIDTAIYAFISEINRRFGIFNKGDRTRYLKTLVRRTRSEAQTFNELMMDNVGKIDILDEEDDDEYDSRTAPSHRFTKKAKMLDGALDEDKIPAKIDLEDFELMKKFRDNIETKLSSETNKDDFDFSFALKIKETQREIENAPDNEGRFNTLVNILQNIGSLVDHNRLYDLMFHETVISGINALGAVYTQICTFREKIRDINNGWTVLVDILDGKDVSDDKTKDDKNKDVATRIVNKAISHPSIHIDSSKYQDLTIGEDGKCKYPGAESALQKINDKKFSELNKSEKMAIFTLGVEKNKMFEYLLEAVYCFCIDSNDLIDIRINNNGLRVNFSKLQVSVQEMFSYVKYFMEKLRPHMDTKKIKHFEDPDHVGSIYWLENKLIDSCFNVYDIDMDNENIFLTTNHNMEKYSLAVSNLYQFLVQNVGTETAPNVLSINEELRNIISSSGSASGTDVVYLPNDLNSVIYQWENGKKMNADAAGVFTPIKINNMLNKISNNQFSLAVQFNKLLYRYLSDSFDTTNGKIYLPLIEKFANDSFIGAVMNNENWDDLVNANKPMTNLLFRSIAKILKNLLTNTMEKSVKKHLFETLSEVPIIQRENLRCKLPYYNKLFATIRSKAEYYRRLTQETLIASHFVGGDNRDSFIKILSEIIKGCIAMENCIRSVYGELNDSPTYFELSESFIRDYKTSNKYSPFMPISTMTEIFTDGKEYSLPFESIGSDQFKFNYGLRGILPDSDVKIGLDVFETFKELLSKVGLLTIRGEKIDDVRAERYVQHFTQMVRFVNDTKNLRHQFVDLHRYKVQNINKTLAGADECIGINMIPTERTGTFQLSEPDLHTTILLTEDNFRDEQERKIAKFMQSDQKRDRNQIRILNIMDMNIIPIDIHAMMREVPLANIYNYSYTFEHMIYRMYREPLVKDNKFDTGKNAFLSMIRDPYSRINLDDYNEGVKAVFTGATETDMNRPKFLSDQVFNKSLFGEITNPKPNTLKYIKNDPNNKPTIKEVAITKKVVIQNLGKLRFDSIFIRNMVFITNIYRLVRYKLWHETTVDKSITTSGSSIIRTDLTEFIDDESIGDDHNTRRFGRDLIKYGNSIRRT